jgi:hypothetical protein
MSKSAGLAAHCSGGGMVSLPGFAKDRAMQYAMLFFIHPEDGAKRRDPEQAAAYTGSWMAYIGAIREAGAFVDGAGLLPAETASVVRLHDGRRQVQDGPYADTKEELGGYVVLEVPDLDAALDWAAQCPALPKGAVEVRPVMARPTATLEQAAE